jgi:hypothetical protein
MGTRVSSEARNWLARRWARWVERTSRRETGETLALVRWVVGTSVLLNLAGTALAGVPEFAWVDMAHGGVRSIRPGWLIAGLGGATPRVIQGVMGATMIAAACVAVGWRSRAAALVAGQGLVALAGLNRNATGAYDMLMTNALWVLVFCDGDATWSLRCRRRTGRWSSDTPVAAWPRYVWVAQLTVAYALAGVQKVSTAWLPIGDLSALYAIMQMPAWTRVDLSWLGRAGIYPLTQLSTALVWTFEITFVLVPLQLWRGRAVADGAGRLRRAWARFDLRVPYAFFGLSMHVGIALMMGVGPFHLIMPAYYAALFRPGELRAVARRFRERVRRAGHGGNDVR